MKDLMKYKNFTSTIHFSAEDEVFYGKVIGIDDSVTFEGQSVKELKKSFKEAIDDYLLLCAQAGKDPHKSYKGSFNVRINPEIHKKAAYKSMQLGISLNQFVEQAITKSISKDKRPN